MRIAKHALLALASWWIAAIGLTINPFTMPSAFHFTWVATFFALGIGASIWQIDNYMEGRPPLYLGDDE